MKELHFEYHMRLSFDRPVEKHRFTLKCIPLSNERQDIRISEINVFPNEFISTDLDSFGNHCIYGYAEGKHDHFSVDVIGDARTGLCAYETAKEDHQLGGFRYQTKHTEPGEAIRKFAGQFHFPESVTAEDSRIF